MRLLIQRVDEASVSVSGALKSQITKGLLVFVGFEDSDDESDIEWGSKKLIQLRIFEDSNNIPNLSILDIDGEILLVSQFTLHAATKKGNRPSYIKASKGSVAIHLYHQLINELEMGLNKKIATGEFGVEMKVSLINNGPHTIWMDSKNKE